MPILLAGAWDEAKAADREAIATLARQPYEKVVAEIVRWLNCSDPPIRRVGSVWQLLSREDSWHFLSRFLVRDDLEIFESVVLSVLKTPDPQYELPSEERFAANIYGKALSHSGFLRRGLADTLAMLATRGLPLELQAPRSAQIWSSLREVIYKHREFPDAKWAMPPESVNRLYLVYHSFEPKDLVWRYAWIFSHGLRLLDCIERDWKIREEKVRQAQARATKEIYSQGGIAALLELAARAKEPRLLGWAIAGIETIAEVEAELLRATLGQENKLLNELAVGFVSSRLEIAGWNWVEEMLALGRTEHWLAQQIINVFWGLPFEPHTWDLLALFDEDVKQLYWQTVRVFWSIRDGCETAIRKLLEVGRPYTALNLAGGHLSNERQPVLLPPTLLVEILEKAASVNRDTEKLLTDNSLVEYHIQEIFDLLEKSNNIEDHKMARLEWLYLPLLTHSQRQPKLYTESFPKIPCSLPRS